MKTTQSRFGAALLLAGIVSLQSFATAADAPTSPPPPGQPPAARPDRPGRPQNGQQVRDRLEQVAKELGLSDEQKTKVGDILKSESEKMRALRQDESLTQEQRREKAMALRTEIQGKVKEVLTAEQYEKWTKIREQQRERMQRGGQGGPGGAGRPGGPGSPGSPGGPDGANKPKPPQN